MFNISIIEDISSRIFNTLAAKFPIACASDEFYYFPQIRPNEPKWSIWDSFTKDTVTETVHQISNWEKELNLFEINKLTLDAQIDIAILKKFILTLKEQLVEVRVWETQPSFYLTLACIGLAEAQEVEDPAAKHERAKNLHLFLDHASNSIKQVPVLFRDIGLEMIEDTKNYIGFLSKRLPELNSALFALDRFEKSLLNVSTRKHFHLSKELLERIVHFHFNCNMEIEEAEYWLDEEINVMKKILNVEAAYFFPNQVMDQASWINALSYIKTPTIGKDGPLGLYKKEIKNLANHCKDMGFILPKLLSSCPVHIAQMPDYLSAIRTSSSYSILPKQPPTCGTFYVINSTLQDKADLKRHLEYKMLAAHETYPGHHLLDASRLNFARFSRRAIEQPIFYEGWACFAEELMKITGYFKSPKDRLLLAKRRLWRAIRGKIDLGLQTGQMNLKKATMLLKEVGIGQKQALSLMRKYPLNPGYQLCYTLGLKSFLELFNLYGKNNIKDFTQTILKQGEIQFIDLKNIFEHSRDN